MAVDFGALNAFLGIRESYQMPDALMAALLDPARRVELLGMVADGVGGETDPLRDYFQENHANRDAMMQDYTPDCLCELVSGLARYQTTINIQVDVFKHLEFEVHNEPETQREIVEAFAKLDERIADEQRAIDRLKDFKSWQLDTMFA